MLERGYFDASITYEGDDFIKSADYVLLPVYLMIIILLFLFLHNLTSSKSVLDRYFMPALIAKLIGAIGVGLIYQYYYNGGDTTLYFLGGRAIYYAFQTGWDYVLAIYRSDAGQPDPLISNLTWVIPYFRDPNGFFVDKIMGFFATAGAGYYLTTAVLNAAFWFPGMWLLYVSVTKMYPGHERMMAYGVLFIPSVVFWGSGILKDTITISCVGYITYGMYLILFRGRRIIFAIIIIAIASYFLYRVKPYILFAYIPGAVMWIVLRAKGAIRSVFLQNIIVPFALLIGLAGGFIIISQIGKSLEKYNIQNALETAQSFQQWHTYLATNENASGYTLGVSGAGTLGVLKSFLPAVGTTLFRPFLWEVRNPVMLLSSLESTIFLIVTLRIIFRVGLRTFFSELVNDPFLFFCFFFSLVFGFIVGFTAFNFGALVRYKIPCMPFYAVMLIVLNYRSIEIRKKRDAERMERKNTRAQFAKVEFDTVT